MSSDDVAGAAMTNVLLVKQQLDSHEVICAERYSGIHVSIGELKGSLGEIRTLMIRGVGAVVTLAFVVLGWSLVQQWETGKAQAAMMEARIERLATKPG